MYDEFNQVITTCSQVNEYTNKDGEIQKGTTLTFTYKGKPKREMDTEPIQTEVN